MILCGFVELVAPVVAQCLSKAVDAAQRSSQVVRNRVAERFQLAVEQDLFMHRPLEPRIDVAQLALSRPQAQSGTAQGQVQAADFVESPRGFVMKTLTVGQALRIPLESRDAGGDVGREPPAGRERGREAPEQRHQDDGP